MANNRATQINKVLKIVKKRYQPVEVPKGRSVLEHLLFACCLENSLHDPATLVFESLSQDYYDWNEVRVTSLRELADVMKPLNDPDQSATRLKRVLQSVFETHYSFDLEPMRKQNIGQSVKQIDKYNGTSPFVVAYVTQHALGGHSIPVNRGLLESMRVVGVISDAEAAKRAVPGLERAVPKTKGAEVGSLLHQLGVELHRSPYGPTIRKILLEIEPSCKADLPKRPSKKTASKKSAKNGEPAATKKKPKQAAATATTKTKAPAKAKSETKKKPAKKKPVAKKKPKKAADKTT